MIYVRNSGFFKFLKYHKFKKEQKMLKQSGCLDNEEEEDPNKNNFDKFHDFLDKAYSVKYPSKAFYVFAIPLLTLSIILAAIYKSTI